MSCGESPKKELGLAGHPEHKISEPSEQVYILSDDQSKNFTPKAEDSQALAVHPPDLKKLHIPRPPKGRQKPVLMARAHKTQPTHSLNLDPESLPPDCTGSEWLRFDDQGMVLPHCILGSLEDFRSYLEAKGMTELLTRIPKSQRDPPSETPGWPPSEAVENERGLPSGHRNIQSNALQRWDIHMMQRRRQQGLLSDLLDRPAENLLMNHANRVRETQEQREFIIQGHPVGIDFGNLRQCSEDEMGGITPTLPQTERGRWEPVTHVTQPSSTRQESGGEETLRQDSQTLDQSEHMHHQCQELGEVLQDVDSKKTIYARESIGLGKPCTFVTLCRSPSLEKEEEKKKEYKETKKANLDPLAQYDDVWSDTLPFPALRFCGLLAPWTGNSTTNQGEVGISATVIFETLTGEIATTHLELHNEGSTAIYYSWQQLVVPCHFPNLRSQRKTLCFHFNSSSDVILPGDTKRMVFIFKSETPGIKTEQWQLNTHPVLLQGASIQVTLRGVSLYQDKTADQRLFLETKLEKIVAVKQCRSIVYEMLRGVHSPERPSSPAELYITEEQEFLSKNPKLQYRDQPVDDLKRLWQEVKPGHIWDLSVNTLHQVLLSLPEPESAQETGLAQLNSLLLQLCDPTEPTHHLTAAAVGLQLWRKLLDMMVSQAMWLRKLLGLPEKDTWINEEEESQISDADMADSKDDDDKKSEKRGGAAAKEERRGSRSRFKDVNKGESKSATSEKSLEDSRKKGKRRDEAGKHTMKKQGQEPASLTDTRAESARPQTPDDPNVEPGLMVIYTRLLHKKVYALMEDLVDNMCDLLDEPNEGDEQDTHY
ncbi:MYCBP-associated protein [Acanthopagrus latus]|uniref:MYCBP-associated protein n=1 Tax=Acanthopagrus latus TaxID=8177 RepID=UPI00187CB148|nr:MYCBP-associated protein [Acanthopagrus latus]XP_036971742.1 MYCBP-associated protein [Acanthopagrus latus]